jgi:hypothetical protein
MSGQSNQHHTAQICVNGQVVTAIFDAGLQRSADYCSLCGAKTITECQTCTSPIEGNDWGAYRRPAFCLKCGKPFPWTDATMKAARDLAAIELQDGDRNELADIIENLVVDTPQTTVAATRFKRIRATPAIAEGFKTILISVVTEAAKKRMFG